MQKGTSPEKPIIKKRIIKRSQQSSTSTDSVIENQHPTIVHTKLVETEELKLNETQRQELETLEQEPNMATETDVEGQADPETLPQNPEPEPPTLPLNPTTKQLGSVEGEPIPKVNSVKDTPKDDEVSLKKESNKVESKIKRKLTVKMGAPRLPVGKHSMTLEEWSDIIDEVSQAGNPCQTINVRLAGKVLGRDMEVWQKLWIHSSPSSLFQQLVFATGIEVDEEGEIDLEDAIGKSVIVEVEQQGNFVNVVRFTSTMKAAGSIFRRI